jgi:hypothetical protein
LSGGLPPYGQPGASINKLKYTHTWTYCGCLTLTKGIINSELVLIVNKQLLELMQSNLTKCLCTHVSDFDLGFLCFPGRTYTCSRRLVRLSICLSVVLVSSINWKPMDMICLQWQSALRQSAVPNNHNSFSPRFWIISPFRKILTEFNSLLYYNLFL